MSEICNMAILIMAATELEIAPFYSLFHDGVDFLVHGIGSGSTSYHAAKTLCNKKYNMAIQTGIAGSYANGPESGVAVVVKSDTYADLAIQENGKLIPLFEAGFSSFDTYPFEKGLLKNPWAEKINEPNYRIASAATVNLIQDDMDRTQKIIDLFHPEIETMEGAAFHHVCLMENVPFFQIRGISNEVGVRDKSKWKLTQAITCTIPVIQDILMKFNAGTLWK